MPNQYPTLVDRLQSTFIDTLFILILMYAISSLLDHFNDVPNWVNVTILVGLFFVYEPLCTAMGCTLGNYLKKIRVRRYNDPTKRIHLLQAILRYPIKVLLGWVSFLTIGTNPERRAIHDIACGSVMIKIKN